MKIQEIKFKDIKTNYSILIGDNILGILPQKIAKLCPLTNKIMIVVDRNVPKRFEKILRKKLKKYDLTFIKFLPNEKVKSLKFANFFLKKLLHNKFNRSDLVIAVGGGVTGDLVGFVSSIYKRGINFINLPSTLLAQVDASIGGKTGVNSSYGKNLIGSFYQPKLVLSDTSFLKSLKKREMICGYAEILKHSIIKDKKFFDWLKKNTQNILVKNAKELVYAIKKSCLVKLFFVNKDVDEKNLRMVLNFGHTFAHAIEVKNNYSSKITHGEAVLSGMVLATKLSKIKKLCSEKTYNEILKIYDENNLSYTYKKFNNKNILDKLIPYLKNDKKNQDKKINFILLNKIGKTYLPNKFKISVSHLKKYSKAMNKF